MAPLIASRAQQIAAGLVVAILAGVGFLPLFGGPGYEHALASGLVVPLAAAIATAMDVAGAPRASPLACVRRGLASGAALAALAFATALVHAVRVGLCDLWGGATLFGLTAACGALMGGVWGALVGLTGEAIRPSRRVGAEGGISVGRRVALALTATAGPASGVAVSVARFYGSPMIFAYDPFFGYFSGTLYDTVVDVRTELWTYRAGSTATLLGAALIAGALHRAPSGGLTLFTPGTRARATARLALGISALAASLAISAGGAALGHFQSAASIARALGARASGPRCDIVYPDSVATSVAKVMVLDCEQEVAAVESRLSTRLNGRLTVFEFADANQKRRLMGAAETSIAKPWRREVYVQMAGYPHPVLGHEIAHVVAGSFARGPFRVGGGLWPNPGIIEGVAVATSPDDDELTAAQWARAMLDAGILPPARQVFSMAFLGQSAEKSYTVAGAFVAWVMQVPGWGPELLHMWYRGASIEILTSRSWDGLDAAFRDWLRDKPMPAAAVEYARSRFERPSLWRRKCPHVVDALDRAGDRCLEEHRFERAVELYRGALERDPQDWRASYGRGWALLRLGERDGGRESLARIQSDALAPRTWRDRAQEAIADDDLLHGQEGAAGDSYRAIAARTANEDSARTLEVKALCADDPMARRAVIDLLIGESGAPEDPWLGALSVGQWAAETHDPLAEYLVGKNLTLRGHYGLGATHLDRALADGVPTERVGRELLRDRAVCACALGDRELLARVGVAAVAGGSPFAESAGGRRESLLRLVERCRAGPAAR